MVIILHTILCTYNFTYYVSMRCTAVYAILTQAISLNSWQKGQVCHLKDDTYPCMQPGKNTLTCKLICVNFWSRCWFYADFFLRWFIFLAFTLWVAAVAVTATFVMIWWQGFWRQSSFSVWRFMMVTYSFSSINVLKKSFKEAILLEMIGWKYSGETKAAAQSARPKLT